MSIQRHGGGVRPDLKQARQTYASTMGGSLALDVIDYVEHLEVWIAELNTVRDELQYMLDVQPGKRVPYLRGLHGVNVVQRAVETIDRLVLRVVQADKRRAKLRRRRAPNGGRA